ncbi:MAG: PilZ domain-containing protein, partial [Devosia sp.]
WLKQKHLKSLPDRREAKRWLPRDSHSSLILPDKREIDCFIIDVSASGAAVSADVMPAMGHPVVVGTVLARVVRALEYGFAVQFLTPRDPQTVEPLLVPPKGSKRELLAQALAEAEAAYEATLAKAGGTSEGSTASA